MSKWVWRSMFVIVLGLLAPFGSVAAASSMTLFDSEALTKGVLRVNYEQSPDRETIIRVTKGKVSYDYRMSPGAQYPLQLGDGVYKVLIAQSVSDTKYKVITQEELTLKQGVGNDVFLQSISLINWSNSTSAVIKARELTLRAETDQAKLKAIYTYITKNIKYDTLEAKTVSSKYTPEVDEIYKSSKGICYDFATLFAAMARSAGLPTKVVKGYHADAPATYHAWNEVYIDNKWQTVDTTYDAAYVQHGKTPTLFKAASQYKTVKFY
ncbi:transglutaminase-like domain-containing protein [Paenibacillus swuensis]|uniref:transglutaminase-like domain-containing protein n=1 Tax=Paenibacillus swuensis TaxID=1178515 RepID=UPI000AE96B46|nr:transglutaminase-like domain-containing protein [Paenibacillus swuensis]